MMTTWRSVRGAVLLALGLLDAVACTMDRDAPVAAAIQCQSEADCPPTHLCKPSLGRCVPRAGLDDQAPALETIWELGPEVGAAGTVFRLVFSASEVLGRDPVVGCTTVAGQVLPWQLDAAATDRPARRYTFVYLALGSEGDGACTLGVDLVDLSGNEVTGLGAGVLMFDFTPPRLAGPVQVTPAQAASGSILHAAVGLSEPLAAAPVLQLVRADDATTVLPLELVAQPDPTAFTFRYVVRGDEAEGAYGVRVQARDVAGNVLDQRRDEGARLDFTAPALLHAAFENALVARGGTVTLVIEADEVLGEPAALTWEGQADPGLSVLSSDAARTVFTRRVDDAAPEGSFRLTQVGLVDAVGNRAQRAAQATVTIDRTAPTFTQLRARPARASRQLGFERLAVAIELDEPVRVLQLELGERPVDCPAADASQQRFACDLAIVEDDVEGPTLVRASVEDLAGNPAFASRGVELDFSPPGVVDGTTSLQLLPAPGNALRDVSRATRGTRVQVGFAVSEELASPPRVHLAGLADARFEALGSSSVFYLYQLAVDDTVPDGAHGVVVELVDAVGNPATVNLALPASLIIDHTAPAVDTARLRLTRIPWGAAETAGATALIVDGELGVDATEAGGTLIVYDAATPPRLELGRQAVGASGSVAHLALNPSDRVEVHVEYLDPAGNPSLAARVDGGAWVATLGRKLAGDLSANPHRAFTRRLFAAPLLPGSRPGSGVLELGGAELALPEGSVASVRGAAGTWRHIEAAYALSRLSGYHVVDDPGRGPLFLAGWASGQPGVFWEWNGHHWRPAEVTDPERDGSPAVTTSDRLVYDGRSNRVLLLQTTGLAAMDTWAWDGLSWARLSPDRQPSPARVDPAVSYVGTLGGVLLFGGRRQTTVFQDLWLWRDAGWQLLSLPAGSPRPPARAGAALVYNPTRLETLLYGGCDGNCGTPAPRLRSDLWAFDGEGWSPREPADAAAPWPPPLVGHQMFTLPGGAVLLYGGESPSGTNDHAWLYDGAGWLGPIAGPTAGNPAAPRAAVFHSTMGEGLAIADHALWALGETGWTERRSTPLDPEGDGEPDPARTAIGLAYDATRGLTVLHQGIDDGGTLAPETWSYDGRSWALRGDGVPETAPVQLAHRSGDGKVYLLQANKLFTLEDWSWVAAEMPVQAVGSQALAADRGSGGLLLMGGLFEKEPGTVGFSAATWTGDGAAWDLFDADVGVPPRGQHALGWDGHAVVLYGGIDDSDGGNTYLDDMWRWDGSAWGKVGRSDPWPGERFNHALVWDAAHARLLLVGGAGAGDRLWAFDGARWEGLDARSIDLFGDGAPALYGKVDPAWATYDEARERLLVLQGGETDAAGLWEWQWLASGAPGHSVDIDLHAARLPDDVAWEALEVQAVARGAAADGTAADVTLLVWVDGAWAVCGRYAAGDPISWRASAGLAWYLSRSGRLHLGLRPEVANGVDGAELAVDYIEVRVQYRLP